MATSNISVNPLTFSQRKLFKDGTDRPDPKEFSKFLSDLGQWANQIQTALLSPSLLASILNGSAVLQQSALITVSQNVTGTSSFACDGASLVSVNVGMTAAAATITMTHVPIPAIVCVRTVNNSGTNEVLKFSMTTPAGTAYATRAVFVSAGAETDMTATGFTVNTGTVQYFIGFTNTGGSVFFLSL